MTTEDDFQNLLDRNPDDHHTRRIFGDWLEERGGPRAEGYRAMGELRLRPDGWGENRCCWRAKRNHMEGGAYQRCTLPDDWYSLLPEGATYEFAKHDIALAKNRRYCEDAAALAFAKLPAARRDELLNPTPVTVTSDSS